MSQPNTHTVLLERTFAHPPAKLWRALTESPLLAQWLLANDFEPVPAHRFQFRADPMPPHWDGLIDCEVTLVDPPHRLAYTWRSLGLDSVVHFTLTPTADGTHVRVEQTGFRPDQKAAYQGATYGWQHFLGKLDRVLGELRP